MSDCSRCGTTLPLGTRYCGSCGRQAIDPGAATMLVGAEEDSLLSEVRQSLAGEYDVEHEVGRGAMAIVFKATEAALHRRVALKVLPPELSLNRGLADRFKREARMAAALEHPNIIPVYREGQTGRFLYIAMKLIEGRPLDDILSSQGPLPIAVVVQVLRSVASALAYAHDRGIVHRDIKGANILVDRDGRVMVSDFGIARAAEDASMTSTGMMIGTPYFMSPEQCAARRIGPQSDQYSLGVVGFQLLTGFVPFQAETLPGIMHHHFYTPVPDIGTVRADAPPELLQIVMRALAKKPEQRFGSTQAMVAALDAMPFGERERLAGDAMLRDLALGLPVAQINAGTLPALPTVVRLTPRGPEAIADARPALGQRRRSALVGAALATVVVSAIGAGLLRPWERAPAPATLAVAGPFAVVPAPIDSTRALPDTGLAALEQPAAPAAATRSRQAAAPGSASVTPAAQPGFVRIRAYPADAQILIDDQVAGVGVVLDASVPKGARRLRVKAPGYRTFDSTFSVLAGELTQIPKITLTATDEPK